MWQICDRLDGQKRCFVLYERLDLYLNPGLEATGALGSFVVRHSLDRRWDFSQPILRKALYLQKAC